MQQKQNQAAIGQKCIDIISAAGLFEGEGSIFTASHQPHKRHLCLTSTDKDVMFNFVGTVGYGRVMGPYGPYNRSNNKLPYYKWDISEPTEVLRILKLFLPYLGNRRTEKAIEAICFLNEITN